MKKTLNDALYSAAKKSAENDTLNHPKKVRELINKIMDNKGCNHLEITAYNIPIRFERNSSTNNTDLTAIYKGKRYSGQELDTLFNKLDHIGPEYTEKRKRDQSIKNGKALLNRATRVGSVELQRSIVSAPIQSATEGRGLLETLLRLAGRTIYKTTQTR